MTVAFSCHRAIAPMLWAFVALSGIEALTVHLFLSHWFPRTALVLSAVTLAGMVWFVRMILSLRTHPVEIGDDRLLLRVGRLAGIETDPRNVAGVRTNWSAADLKAPGVLKLSLLAWPNVVLDLARPVPHRRRLVTTVAHRLDDASGFVRALELGTRGPHG